jgi:hypothetical protein
MKISRDFSKRPPEEQRWFIEETWCEKCKLPDIGLLEPKEYEEDGKIYVEGKCKVCGNRVVNEIVGDK